MPSTSKFSKHGLKRLKKFISQEQEHREILISGCETAEMRLGLLKMEMEGASISITHFNGTDKTCNSLIKTGITTEKLEERVKEFKIAINMSRWKEKFFRYIYLEDKENAIKYDKKLAEAWNDGLDKFMEADRNGEKIGYVLNEFDHPEEEKTIAESSEAIRRMGQSMSKAYENRKLLLSVIN